MGWRHLQDIRSGLVDEIDAATPCFGTDQACLARGSRGRGCPNRSAGAAKEDSGTVIDSAGPGLSIRAGEDPARDEAALG